MTQRKLQGLTDAEEDMLQLMFALKPWGQDRVSRNVAKYLDGDDHALDAAPTLKERIDTTVSAYRAEKEAA